MSSEAVSRYFRRFLICIEILYQIPQGLSPVEYLRLNSCCARSHLNLAILSHGIWTSVKQDFVQLPVRPIVRFPLA